MAFLPREVIHWLDGLDLAYSIRNLKRDLSNGFIVAEILSRRWPKDFNIYSYDNGSKLEKKRDNWEQISKQLAKMKWELTKLEYEPIMYYAEGAAEDFFKKLYEFMTSKKFPDRPRPAMKSQPHWMRPTASYLSKDTELARIVDNKEKELKTTMQLALHKETKKTELKKMELDKYIQSKRTQFFQLKAEEKAQQELKAKSRKPVEPIIGDIIEIQVNTVEKGKKSNKDQAQAMAFELKGSLEFITENMKEFLDEIREKEMEDLKKPENVSMFQFILDNIKEFNDDTMAMFFQNLKYHIPGIVERLSNNYSEFKIFFGIFKKPLMDLYWKSATFSVVVEFLKSLGGDLLKADASTTEIMFSSIAIPDFIDIIIAYPNKREDICQIIFSYCTISSTSRQKFIHKIGEKLALNLKVFISVLSIVVSFDYEEDFTEELYNLFYFNGLRALDFPSPFTRAHGLKILSEITAISPYPVMQILGKFKNLVKDSWWEVRSLLIILCSSLLMYIAREKETPSPKMNNPSPRPDANISDDIETEMISRKQDENEDNQDIQGVNEQLKVKSFEDEEAFLIDLISDLFSLNSNQNILKIGLIYLANTLTKYPILCPRYLEILLNISDEIRASVLDIAPLPGMEEGYIAQNSFKYKLTGAPLIWNAVGIAEALESYVKPENLDSFDRVHCEILAGCLVQPLEQSDGEIWFRIYENLKSYIFVGLCERDLCQLCSEVAKKFFTFNVIQDRVLETSRKTIYKTLMLLYHPDREMICKENFLEFLDYLQNQGVEKFKEYNYVIIKEFSEKNKVQFLQSNLVDFMNNIAKQRREKLFGPSILN